MRWGLSSVIIDHINVFIPRQGTNGLGLGDGNNLNLPWFRLLKTQENFPLPVIKLYNKLPQDETVLSLKRFESQVWPWSMAWNRIPSTP